MKTRLPLFLRHALSLVGLLLLSSGVVAYPGEAKAWRELENDLITQGLECRLTEDKIARLLCFDALFRTPLERKEPPVLPALTKPVAISRPGGPIRTLVEQIERSRSPDETGWVARFRPWMSDHLLTFDAFERGLSDRGSRAGSTQIWDRERVDVFVTVMEAQPESGPPSASLLVACDNDITILGVLLPRPISTLQANLSLMSDRGTNLKLNWRDAENGDVIIAGRGLESIDTIKAIMTYEQVRLQVVYPEGPRSFVFNILDLKERLKPLRTACHW